MTLGRGAEFFEASWPELLKIPGLAFAGLPWLPGVAFACALPPSVILTLPTGSSITVAALTVGLTGLVGALGNRLPALSWHPVPERRQGLLQGAIPTDPFGMIARISLFRPESAAGRTWLMRDWPGAQVVVMALIHATRFAAVLAALLPAVVAGPKLAGPGTRPLAHLPVTKLMVLYAVPGLWQPSKARTG